MPTRAHPTDAGIDLYSAAYVELEPGCRSLVPTGIAIAIPDGYAGFIHPRSGWAAKFGLSIANTPGTIDSDYRGEIKVCLINLDSVCDIHIEPGDRIAQLVVQKIELPELYEPTKQIDIDMFYNTDRGGNGFGSTGV